MILIDQAFPAWTDVVKRGDRTNIDKLARRRSVQQPQRSDEIRPIVAHDVVALKRRAIEAVVDDALRTVKQFRPRALIILLSDNESVDERLHMPAPAR